MDDGDITDLSLVGATATGKTALGARLRAARIPTSSSSRRTRSPSIAASTSARPNRRAKNARLAPWHLIDVCDPAEEFTVARFQRLAADAIAGIEGRGHRTLIVGGTGLYHRAVVDDLGLPGQYPEIRAELEETVCTTTGLELLYARLVALDPHAASRMEPTNARRIVARSRSRSARGGRSRRSDRDWRTTGRRDSRLPDCFSRREVLDRRISERLDRQLSEGFVDEAARLAARPGGLSRTARQALGYKELFSYLASECTLEEASAEIIRRTKSFARRQEAWFRRDPRIVWIDASGPDLVSRFAALADPGARRDREPARD